jgi:hypothetical protein
VDRTPIVLVLALASVFACGCGPSERELREARERLEQKERTLSVLNTEADRWDGGPEFTTSAVDAYGQPLTWRVEKTTFNYVLELRSSGPDQLPKNTDDMVVTRKKSHGETSLTKQASKAVEEVSSAGTSGIIKGVKKGLLGSGENPKK